MTWGKHLGITLFFALIIVAFSFVYAEFMLIDSVVPAEGIELSQWIEGYELAAILAAVAGTVMSAIWFFMGKNYNGGSGITSKYLIAMVLSLILGFSTYVFLDPAVDGAGVAKLLLPLNSFVIYYLSSLFASADAVRNIPPLSEMIH